MFRTQRLRYVDLWADARVPYTVTTLLGGLIAVHHRGVSELRFVPWPGLGLQGFVFWGRDDIVHEVERALLKHAGIAPRRPSRQGT